MLASLSFVAFFSGWFLGAHGQRNDGITLAVGPNCGSLSGEPVDVNAGLLPIAQYKTIVAFGVSKLLTFTLSHLLIISRIHTRMEG